MGRPPHGRSIRRPAKRADTGSLRHLVAVKDRKSTRLNSSHLVISYAVFCLKKKKYENTPRHRKNSQIPTIVKFKYAEGNEMTKTETERIKNVDILGHYNKN